MNSNINRTSTETSAYQQNDMYKNGHISFIHNSQI